MIRAYEVVGRRFGRLVVTKVAEHRATDGRPLVEVVCECGNTRVLRHRRLLSGETRSCGCLRADMMAAKQFRHGYVGSSVYKKWNNMLSRCRNPKASKYALYGGRGITVCERWVSFTNFLADIGEPPTDKHEPDRIDNDKGYEPGNVRWATHTQNARNTRSNHFITANGETHCLAEWSEVTGISPDTIMRRLTSGWSPESAILTPVRQRRRVAG